MRDFARDRGIALLLVGVLLGTTVVAPAKAIGALQNEEMIRPVLSAILSQVAFILSFITLNGIISNDRKMGYYRFLFSKPVSIPAYYVQLFVVYFAGFLAACAVLLGVFNVFAGPASPLEPLAFCALVFLSIGGIGFLVSSLFRYDWPILAGVLLGTTVLHAVWGNKEGWQKMILAVLPPLHELTPALSDIMGNGKVHTNSLLWLIGYSALCFAAGVLVLKRRSFA